MVVVTRESKDSSPSKVENAKGKRKLDGDEAEPLQIEPKQQKLERKKLFRGKTMDSTPSKVENAKGKKKLEGDEADPLQIEPKQQKLERKKFFRGKVKYRYEEEDSFYGRININSRKAIIHEIENNLTPIDWQKIVDGPFGKIIEIVKQVTFSPQLIHGILLKQLETKKKWETWYGVGGKKIHFSLKEYHLISGLNSGLPPKIEVKAYKLVMKRIFGGLGAYKPTINDLLERFKACREDSNYKFKLALLLIVDGLIFGGDKNKLVNAEHVKLLETMDWFVNTHGALSGISNFIKV